MHRLSFFYLLLLLCCGAGIAITLQLGAALPDQVASAPDTTASTWAGLLTNLDSPLSHLFIQLTVIIIVSRLLSRLFKVLGQPAVIGEMAAGILLGPSLLGLFAPGLFAFIFPADSLDTLKLLSQIGICLFMFTVGMQLNTTHLRHSAQAAIAVSHTSILFPYLLGVLLAYALYQQLADPGTAFIPFALFMGIAMSITAFPVLARIIHERDLAQTPLGNTAISCAAIDDITAWSLLAFVIAIAQASGFGSSLLTIGLTLLFAVLMLGGLRPRLPRWLKADAEQQEISQATLAAILCLVVAASLCTEIIGIHALFGAFLVGVIMPNTNNFRARVNLRVESVSAILLLPLFFTFTGLRTQIGLLEGWHDWLLCLLIIAVATLGKLGGSAVAARLAGMPWHTALQLGALMNTRGLMELIVLNIGYDLGILSPRVFTMMVIMALVTTLLTSPLLSLFGKSPSPNVKPPSGLDPLP